MSGNLLIVVGAGASKEFGLPIGEELKKHISELLAFQRNPGAADISHGDPTLYQALQLQSNRHGTEFNDLWMAARRVSTNLPLAISIDNFIDNHAGDTNIELVGKLGIVRSILKAERGSNLYFNERNAKTLPDFAGLQNVWLTKFFRLLTENCRVDDLPERLQRLTLIVFNYDRCIEHFMFHAFRNYYGTTSEKAAELVGMMKIYHPYGKVGALPWEDGVQQRAEFGADPTHHDLLALAKGIKTFTEGTDPDESRINDIKTQVYDARIALFLGFAFHPLNLSLLSTGLKPEKHYQTKYFATAYGISNSDCDLVQNELTGLAEATSDNILVKSGLTCNQLFHEYSRTISAWNRHE